MVQRGEIYWADFGVPRGHTQAGPRPALIVQNDTGNTYSSTTIVAALTSKFKPPYPFQVPISAFESGLPLDSIVMLDQIYTIDKKYLVKLMGKLPKSKMNEVDRALQISFGLPIIA